MSSSIDPARPWMCARHAAKSPRVRAEIMLARGNPRGAMQTIASHNHAAGKQWFWLVLAGRPV